jgi:hypothetical protein
VINFVAVNEHEMNNAHIISKDAFGKYTYSIGVHLPAHVCVILLRVLVTKQHSHFFDMKICNTWAVDSLPNIVS